MFIEPTKEFADIIIPEGGYNTNALRVLASFMNDILS
jgi:uridine kinase